MNQKIESYEKEVHFSANLLSMLKRRGLKYTLKKVFYKTLFPLIRPYVKNKSFTYNNIELNYCNANVDTAHATERSLEIPIIQAELEKRNPASILEIGNVLAHYNVRQYARDIVDKYENGPHVILQDILDYCPNKRYDFIFSISTMEHIGFDEEIKDVTKIQKTIDHIATNLLTEKGVFFMTFPLGWNPTLDKDFISGALQFETSMIFKKTGWKTNWEMINLKQAQCTYGKFVGADYLVVLSAGREFLIKTQNTRSAV